MACGGMWSEVQHDASSPPAGGPGTDAMSRPRTALGGLPAEDTPCNHSPELFPVKPNRRPRPARLNRRDTALGDPVAQGDRVNPKQVGRLIHFEELPIVRYRSHKQILSGRSGRLLGARGRRGRCARPGRRESRQHGSGAGCSPGRAMMGRARNVASMARRLRPSLRRCERVSSASGFASSSVAGSRPLTA